MHPREARTELGRCDFEHQVWTVPNQPAGSEFNGLRELVAQPGRDCNDIGDQIRVMKVWPAHSEQVMSSVPPIPQEDRRTYRPRSQRNGVDRAVQ
jgi:hypothetical protein